MPEAFVHTDLFEFFSQTLQNLTDLTFIMKLRHKSGRSEGAGLVVGNPHGSPAIHSSLKVDRHVAIPSISFLIPPSALHLGCITNCIFEGRLDGEMRCGLPFMAALRSFITDKAVP